MGGTGSRRGRRARGAHVTSEPITRSHGPAGSDSAPQRSISAVTALLPRSCALRFTLPVCSATSPSRPSVSTTRAPPSPAANSPQAPVPAPSSSTLAPRRSLRLSQWHMAAAHGHKVPPTDSRSPAAPSYAESSMTVRISPVCSSRTLSPSRKRSSLPPGSGGRRTSKKVVAAAAESARASRTRRI